MVFGIAPETLTRCFVGEKKAIVIPRKTEGYHPACNDTGAKVGETVFLPSGGGN